MYTNNNESDFFLSHIKKTDTVLEYGSGESTKEIANLCNSVVSVEHQKNWYDIVKNDMPENVTLLLRPSFNYIEEGYNCGTFDEFKDYITIPSEYGKFDIIFIDGRARVECAKYSKNLSHENTIVFIHDFTSRLENHNYKEALEYLDLIESVGDMSKFKIKR